MSRCSICDYSQSADSIFNDGIHLNRSLTNNRVVYSKVHGADICVDCLEDHISQQNYWTVIDGEDDHVPEETAEDASDYCGCTEVEPG